ncbi:3 exoribonuclease family protein [Diaporthe amygdali]|uniref:3 exoribonuclease family protein n=1 Tax=Phomopsis amygdali TaxID=1214568 RepID=UPI0022FF0367|nr:3 exoribonuclease family protein [Diaporthe amygdali]KAJ0125174.1 3 exoribonuclease family protein [Diaporthe amygdali]
MPPKATKRKANAVGLLDNDPWGSPEDRPRKKTRVSTTHVDNLGDRHSSQTTEQLSGWVAWQNRFNEKERTEKRQFADEFTKKLQSKQAEIQNLITSCNNELAAAGEKYSKLVKEAYGDNRPNSKTKPQPQTFASREGNPLFKAGQEIFQSCHELITVHNRANSKASQDNTELGLPRELWKKDIASVQQLLLYGRQHGENIMDCIIVSSSSNDEKSRLLTPDKQGLSETGKMAVDMYRKSTEAINESGSTWGELAKSQAGAFGKIVDDLADV